MPEARAYLGDGRLELDNNICERSIRPVAPGRKNCLFPGSVGGGEAAAIAYALIETAEMNNVDPEAWLTWVLERIADHRLTPSTNSCRGTGSPKTSKTRPDRTDTLIRDIIGMKRASIRCLKPVSRQNVFDYFQEQYLQFIKWVELARSSGCSMNPRRCATPQRSSDLSLSTSHSRLGAYG